MRLLAWLMIAAIAAKSADTISNPAFSEINTRIAQNQAQFYVYQDVDSPFNHGFPSGLWGTAQSKLHLNAGCVYSASAANGCSTDPTAMDQSRGTVFQLVFNPLLSGEYVGLNFEEPENWGANQTGVGYNLTGATQLVVDVVSPTGGISVQFSVNGASTGFYSVSKQWAEIPLNLSSLGVSSLTNVHLLFGVGTNNSNAPNGGVVLIDNVRFQPVPTIQTTSLGLPQANQVFGIEHVTNALSGSIPIPPDQTNANLATLYESSLAIIALIDRGNPLDLTNAKLIADSLAYALGHDNQGDPLPLAGSYSGLHNAYYGGDLTLLDSQSALGGQQGQVRLAGFTAPALCTQTGFCLVLDGATGGNNAFAILGLLAAYKQFQNAAYVNAAVSIGNWIHASLLDTSGTGYGGYVVGYPDEGSAKILQTGKSTENNADIFAAFSGLASVENAAGNSNAGQMWTSWADIAGDFVMQMWDAGTGHFFAGTVPSGQTAAAGIYPNGAQRGNDVINTFDFLDTETFTTLAMAAVPRYANQIDWRRPVQWVVDHFQRSVTAAGSTFQGFDLIQASEHLSTDGPQGVAWEFTGQEVAAMELVDSLYGTSQFVANAGFYLNQIELAQASAPFGDNQGIVASTLQNGDAVVPYNQCLVTPYQCIAERVGLAATLWAIAAEQRIDPLLSIQTGQVPQVVTFGSLASQVKGTAPSALAATASSGLAVAYASSTSSVCAVSASEVTLNTIGECSITASQAGNATWGTASVSQSAAVYLVGDVYSPTTLVPPYFGDGVLDIRDLIQILFSVNNIPGFNPPACSDRLDAMDLYPSDTAAARGGDGVLDIRDLILELFRVNNLDMSRPVRVSRGGVCGSNGPAGATNLDAARRKGAGAPTPRAVSSGALVIGAVERLEDAQERLPIYLEAAENLTRVALTFGLGNQRSQLRFVAAPDQQPSLVQDSQLGVVAGAWLNGVTVPAGARLLLGYLTGPAGTLARLTVYGLSASGLDDNREVRLSVEGATSPAQ